MSVGRRTFEPVTELHLQSSPPYEGGVADPMLFIGSYGVVLCRSPRGDCSLGSSKEPPRPDQGLGPPLLRKEGSLRRLPLVPVTGSLVIYPRCTLDTLTRICYIRF